MRWFVLFLAYPAAAQEVTLVPYSPLTENLSEIIDFEEFPSQLSPGMNHDNPLIFHGATMGERFDGQRTAPDASYDALNGQPLPGLVVKPGAPGENLSVTHIYFQSNQLQGLGPEGFPSRDAGGEGAIAIVFEQDQEQLGFKVSAEIKPDEPAPLGRMTVTFHARDGRIIEQLEVPLDWGRNGYGFERAGGVADIAGVTIENRDPGGIAIDDIVFDLRRAGT